MFKKRWPWGGKIISDEGFEIFFGHKTAYYQDDPANSHLGLRTDSSSQGLIRIPVKLALSQAEIDQMVDRTVRALMWEGLPVQVVPKKSRAAIEERS